MLGYETILEGVKDLEEQDPIKNKPGMMHYIQDSRRLFLSMLLSKESHIKKELKGTLNSDSG